MTMQNDNVIMRIEHLSKAFGKRTILKDISFDTYAGEVFGFLGPNGAGKTTLIKTAVGHLILDAGEISICGHSIKTDYEAAMSYVGGIVENPEFYKYMSGYDNLLQYARAHGDISKERIDEVVHLVGLDNRIREKVGKYSLGMRQRLGVAQALMHRPKLLVLDEPTNGLDPAGIKELRDVLKNIAHEEGASVLVSSHLMSEMELMCDRVGVIVNGELVDVKPISELVASVTVDKADYIYTVGSAEDAEKIIAEIENAEATVVSPDTLEIVLPRTGVAFKLAEINEKLILGGVKLYTVSPKENKRLEDVFIELTGVKEGDQIE